MDYSATIDWIVSRMKEPTTWRGLIGILAGLGVAIDPHQAAIILAVGVGLAGFIGVVSKDPKNIPADIEAALAALGPIAHVIADKTVVDDGSSKVSVEVTTAPTDAPVAAPIAPADAAATITDAVAAPPAPTV